ncbi:MerR family transcriptional regulator [Asticcacaulis benevestitus]|uniref:HTH merR-type domain-containing protein n=1 Tax=Asticcacaulis benevestitus DSM 16100 = ATCC BAA-896 TaxID=1121022 RepID=V4PJ06_9CAUL|nr:MerR family transcriptional regulator [Asticcacaulis benevestitus]ESQ93942.1 hypothetical protein ABENE_04435 [Asticcacaulis benevestitus DSM 16100 = ATCC BAA-896]
MTRYTVKQLADLVRISVRTLHHYDDIGLLKPAYLGNNGYRYYERTQLHRLQQVLMYRDLGLGLDQIGDIMDATDFDVASALRGHRQRLVDRLRSLGDLLSIIETTLRRIDGDDMTDTYPNIWKSDAQAAEYKQWLMERYSEKVDSSVADTRRRITAMTPEERTGLSAQRKAWEGDLVTAFKAGMTVETLAVSELLVRHRILTAAIIGGPCMPETYTSVADAFGYAGYKDHFESLAPGLTVWLTSGMKAWVALDAAA